MKGAGVWGGAGRAGGGRRRGACRCCYAHSALAAGSSLTHVAEGLCKQKAAGGRAADLPQYGTFSRCWCLSVLTYALLRITTAHFTICLSANNGGGKGDWGNPAYSALGRHGGRRKRLH